MVRSLYSGTSGIKTHQTRLDVIGNNLANVNSYGYKASRVIFRDIFYQAAINETAGSGTYAGNNPSTVGYGVQLGSIDKNMSGSNRKSTEKAFDCALNGDGFFITATFNSDEGETHATGVDVVKADAKPNDKTYTRLGAMMIDSNGNLVAGNRFVIGTCNTDANLKADGDGASALNAMNCFGKAAGTRVTDNDITGANTINIHKLIRTAYNDNTLKYEDLQSFQIGKDGVITVMYKDQRKAIARIETAVFTNMDGLVEAGDTSFAKTASSGDATVKRVGDQGAPAQMLSGYLEMSNVNLADEFSDMIVTQRGYQANARIVTTSDEMLEELVNLKR